MARLRRLHIPGGLHYVILHANEGREPFQHEDDYTSFSKLLQLSARSCGARVFAYCWTTTEAHIAIQVSKEPLGRFVQKIAGQHARYMNRKLGLHGHLFQQHYWAVLLQPHTLLPEAVCHTHLIPVRRGLAPDPESYGWSSHHAYLGHTGASWIHTGLIFRAIESPGRSRRRVPSIYSRRPRSLGRQHFEQQLGIHNERPARGCGISITFDAQAPPAA
jgi:putative transposase